MRVALVHDWFTGMRGGEYVFEAIAELFRRPTLLTLLYVPGSASPAITALPRRTSFIQRLPQAERRYRHFLPLMPRAIEALDASEFDLVVSSSHCVAKGIRKREGAVHVSYLHAPMRYMWDRFDDYFGPGQASLPVRLAARAIRGRMQAWDRRASQPDRIDALLANSAFIAAQIRANYGREARVIHPFVDLERFNRRRDPGRNYLMVGAFAPNKRVDLAVEAFNRLKLPLLIVGSGQEEARLKRLAGPTVDFLGPLSNDAIADLYARCRAFVFPGVEDFGITPLEAMASGAPVIAYGAGGALETVVDGRTGLFFSPQEPGALAEAVRKVEAGEAAFDPEACRARAREFSRPAFQAAFLAEVRAAWSRAGKPGDALEAELARPGAPA